MAASTSRSPCRRRPPPWGRVGAGGTTRWNNSHKPAGTNRSTSFVVTPSASRKITPNEMTSKQVMTVAANKAFVILDGTLLHIDRIAADRPYYSGKHKRHGMNVQVIADAFGRLLWVSPALPGAVHDIKAARTHGIIEALTQAGIRTWADRGYQGARGTIRVPYQGRWSTLPAGKRAVNSSHAKIRAVGEQANATLKSWRLLRKLRCSTVRITDIVKAVLVLRLATAA
ncbi:transposase family protein [Streptomyces aureus]|uniref:transposase family protein n=1 Tax=Streptomyces aureus TaxID=193461 RepID=UPI003619D198